VLLLQTVQTAPSGWDNLRDWVSALGSLAAAVVATVTPLKLSASDAPRLNNRYSPSATRSSSSSAWKGWTLRTIAEAAGLRSQRAVQKILEQRPAQAPRSRKR
jgi:hypothetical protein